MTLDKWVIASGAILILLAASSLKPIEAKTEVIIPQGSATNTKLAGYAPSAVTVVIGVNNTVIWSNVDNAPHTVTSDATGVFDSGNLNANQSFTFTFTKTGTYPYHCTYHSWMHGTINVKAGTVVPEFPVGSFPAILFLTMLVAGLGVALFQNHAWRPAATASRVELSTVLSSET